MKMREQFLISAVLSTVLFETVSSIKCYQCSSTEDQRKPSGIWSKDQYSQSRLMGIDTKMYHPTNSSFFYAYTLAGNVNESLNFCCLFTNPYFRFEDNCGVYWPYDTARNIAVECNSDESQTPGTFCVKILKQGPRGFIWDGRWRQVIRRCASESRSGVTGICNWGVQENGVFWEECYCNHDGCNSATNIVFSMYLPILLISTLIYMY